LKLIKKKKIINPSQRVDLFSVLLSSGFFVGFAPIASGTVGSLFALMFFLIPGFSEYNILLPIIIITYPLAIIASGRMIKRYGDDPSVVVIDEIIGMWITILVIKILIPDYFNLNFPVIILSFLSFRMFDIIKIYPSNYFDNLKSGFGIIMDDIISGIQAGILTSALIFVFNKFFL
jgi:phosphatidylglycerophosphatase A